MAPRPVNLDHYSSPSTSRSNIDIMLKSSLLNKPINKMNGFDSRLSADASRVLSQEITFVEAETGYKSVSEKLKSKYPVLKRRDRQDRNLVDNGSISGQLKSNGHQGNLLKLNTTSVVAAPILSDGIPAPSVDLCNAPIKLKWDNFFSNIGVGFRNCGNTCFLNSILQALTYTAPLANYLIFNHNSCNVTLSICALCELRSHVLKVFKQQGYDRTPITPAVANRIKSYMRSYQYGRQEDAHEFLRYFIDAMQNACLSPFKTQKLDLYSKETTGISKIFGGFHRNEIRCSVCKTTSTTYDPFLDLSLEFKGGNSLESFLRHFTRVEKLQGENAYFCERCKRKTEAQKCYKIHRPPNVLTIQLKRFGHCGKIMTHCMFPEKFDLRPFMSIDKGPGELYSLYAVVVHHGGSMNSGHYFAFVRSPKNIWHLMDDCRVSTVGIQNVQNAQAYLLFYIRQNVTANAEVSFSPHVSSNGCSFKHPSANAREDPKSSPGVVRKFATAVSPLTQPRSPVVIPMACKSPSTLLNGSQVNGSLKNGSLATVSNGTATSTNKTTGILGAKAPNSASMNQSVSNGVPKQPGGPVKPIQDATVTTTTCLVPYDDEDDSDTSASCQNSALPSLRNGKASPNGLAGVPLRKDTSVTQSTANSVCAAPKQNNTSPMASSPALKFVPNAIVKKSISSSKPSSAAASGNSATESSKPVANPVAANSCCKSDEKKPVSEDVQAEARLPVSDPMPTKLQDVPVASARREMNGNSHQKSATDTAQTNAGVKKSAFEHFQQQKEKSAEAAVNGVRSHAGADSAVSHQQPVLNTHKRFCSSPESDRSETPPAKIARVCVTDPVIKKKKKKRNKKKRHSVEAATNGEVDPLDTVELTPAPSKLQDEERCSAAAERIEFIKKKKKKNKNYRERDRTESHEEDGHRRHQSHEKKHKRRCSSPEEEKERRRVKKSEKLLSSPSQHRHHHQQDRYRHHSDYVASNKASDEHVRRERSTASKSSVSSVERSQKRRENTFEHNSEFKHRKRRPSWDQDDLPRNRANHQRSGGEVVFSSCSSSKHRKRKRRSSSSS